MEQKKILNNVRIIGHPEIRVSSWPYPRYAENGIYAIPLTEVVAVQTGNGKDFYTVDETFHNPEWFTKRKLALIVLKDMSIGIARIKDAE